jgi:EAL domain-containing protein (putative c-di-GMP-specific phosphodiesterase class I)
MKKAHSSDERTLHIEEFVLKNKLDLLTWVIYTFIVVIMLSVILSLVYRILTFNTLSEILTTSTILRLGNLCLVFSSLYFLREEKFTTSTYLIFMSIIITLLIPIIYPNDNVLIAIVSYCLTLFISLFFVTVIWMDRKHIRTSGLFAILLINGYFIYLNNMGSEYGSILSDLIIVLNYFIFTAIIFNVIFIVSHSRIIKYLDQLVYIDLKTGIHNEREFAHRINQLTEENRAYIVLAVYLSNINDLNYQYTYRIVHKMYLKKVNALKEAMSGIGESYKLEGPLFAYIIPKEKKILLDLESRIDYVNGLFNDSFLDNKEKIVFQTKWLATRYPQDGENVDEIIDNIYHLKHSKTGVQQKIQWYDETAFNKEKRLIELETDLVKAIENKEIEIAIQAQQDLKTSELHGVEILARWTHGKYGRISPVEFILMVEQLNLMNEFTSVILEKTRTALKLIENEKIKIPKYAVNVSASSIMDNSILSLVDEFDSRLELEITEGVLMDLNEASTKILQKLKNKGFSLSIDDFGTGFSNLEYLHILDVDYLKIDKRFIDSMMTNEKAMNLVEALLSMAHKLDIKVIAEGVETKMQKEVLMTLSCDIIQGYYYSKPLTIEGFVDKFK